MYIIYKVNCNSGNCDLIHCNDSDEIKIEVDTIFNKIGEARHYINNLETIIVNKEKCVITKVLERKPTDKDDDGYYLVKNINIDNRVDIYKKKTKLIEGYLYNSYEIKIEKIVFYEIKFFDKTINVNDVRTTCSNFNKELRPNSNKSYVLPVDLLEELKEKLAKKSKID